MVCGALPLHCATAAAGGEKFESGRPSSRSNHLSTQPRWEPPIHLRVSCNQAPAFAHTHTFCSSSGGGKQRAKQLLPLLLRAGLSARPSVRPSVRSLPAASRRECLRAGRARAAQKHAGRGCICVCLCARLHLLASMSAQRADTLPRQVRRRRRRRQRSRRPPVRADRSGASDADADAEACPWRSALACRLRGSLGGGGGGACTSREFGREESGDEERSRCVDSAADFAGARLAIVVVGGGGSFNLRPLVGCAQLDASAGADLRNSAPPPTQSRRFDE